MKDQTATLRHELEELKTQIAKLERALEEKPDYGLGQGDPAVTSWELNRALLHQLRERAESLEEALSQLDEGTYGICEQCGERIHPDRLAVLPDTRICVRCAQAGKRN